MNIRIITADDAELLTDLRMAMRRERESVKLEISEAEFRQNNLEYFRKAISDGSYFGVAAEIDGQIAATGGICFHIHPPSYSVLNGKSACLLNMYTLPDYRGRGIAGKIVLYLLEIAKKNGCSQVTLNASSMGKSLYSKIGFKDVANEMVYQF